MFRSLSIAIEECWRHPWRTLLVSQGILWAVTMIVLPAAVIDGSRRQALERAEELGTDLLQVEPAPGVGPSAAPREEDLPAIEDLLPPEGLVSAIRAQAVSIADDAEKRTSWWVGVDDQHQFAGYIVLFDEFVRIGRFCKRQLSLYHRFYCAFFQQGPDLFL